MSERPTIYESRARRRRRRFHSALAGAARRGRLSSVERAVAAIPGLECAAVRVGSQHLSRDSGLRRRRSAVGLLAPAPAARRLARLADVESAPGGGGDDPVPARRHLPGTSSSVILVVKSTAGESDLENPRRLTDASRGGRVGQGGRPHRPPAEAGTRTRFVWGKAAGPAGSRPPERLRFSAGDLRLHAQLRLFLC